MPANTAVMKDVIIGNARQAGADILVLLDEMHHIGGKDVGSNQVFCKYEKAWSSLVSNLLLRLIRMGTFKSPVTRRKRKFSQISKRL